MAMPLELKKSPFLFAYAAFLVVVAGVLAWKKVMTAEAAVAFVTGALAFPGLIGAGGKKKDDDDEHPPAGQTPVLVDEVPPVHPRSRGGDVLRPFAAIAARFHPYRTPSPPPPYPTLVEAQTSRPKPSATPVHHPGSLVLGSLTLNLFVAVTATCVMVIATVVVGCASATPQEKSAAAEATYAGDMLKCVDDSSSREESKACREKVRQRWHVDAGGVR